MTDYQVTLDYELGHDVDDDTIDKVLRVLEDHAPAVSSLGNRLTVTASMPGSDAQDAVFGAAHALAWLAEPVGVRAITEDSADAEANEPAIPPLVGAAEAAEILGVSRQRVHELRSTNDSFPPAAYQLRQGPLWLESAIRSWGETRRRSPGRPAGTRPVVDDDVPAFDR